MHSRGILILVLAVVLGGTSVWLARGWLESQVRVETVFKEAPAKPAATVVVASTPLSFGNNIRREHLRVVDWPAGSVPQGAFTSVDELLGDGGQRVALKSIETNEPVLKSKVSGFGGRATLSAVISPDMRASTIRVNDVNGVAGFVLPGDHVDILLTRKKGERLIGDILLQNILVLGIDQDANEDREQPAVVKAVTVEVTPHQSQKLSLAQQVGTLSLALRAVTDSNPGEFTTVSIGDLTIGEANIPVAAGTRTVTAAQNDSPAPPRAAQPRTKPKALVRIVRGLHATEYDVKPEAGGTVTVKDAATPKTPTPVTQAPAVAPQKGELGAEAPKPADAPDLVSQTSSEDPPALAQALQSLRRFAPQEPGGTSQ